MLFLGEIIPGEAHVQHFNSYAYPHHNTWPDLSISLAGAKEDIQLVRTGQGQLSLLANGLSMKSLSALKVMLNGKDLAETLSKLQKQCAQCGGGGGPALRPLSKDPNAWLQVFDCTVKDKKAVRQLVTRENVIKVMKTAEYIAICDHDSPPHKSNNCVFAKRGSTPFENLAKGASINSKTKNGGCDLNCVKESWTGDAQRISWLPYGACDGATDYSKGLIYHACGNGNGLHMYVDHKQHDACGWNNNYNKFPSVWIQTPSPSSDPEAWLEVFDCTARDKKAVRQLVARANVIEAMKTAEYIAICDDDSPPNKKTNCVFAKRGSTPFENLAKGASVNSKNGACDLNCVKQWWTGDAQRISWLPWSCGHGATDYSKGLIYQACGNGNGLHMYADHPKHDACGWNNNYNKLPSIWIQTPSASSFLPPSNNPGAWLEVFDCTTKDKRAVRQIVSRDYVIKAMKTAYYVAICDHDSPPHKKTNCVYTKRGTTPFENLARGASINSKSGGCDLNCVKQWWTGDAQRISWLPWSCPHGAADYSKGLIYQACGNGGGLHMYVNHPQHDACGWNNNYNKLPSVWIQTAK